MVAFRFEIAFQGANRGNPIGPQSRTNKQDRAMVAESRNAGSPSRKQHFSALCVQVIGMNGWVTIEAKDRQIAEKTLDASKEQLRMKRIALAMSLAAGALMVAAPAFPQQNENEGRGQAVVTVLPAHDNSPEPNLTTQDLAIKVNGKVSTITNFMPLRGQNDRLELVVLIDSGARDSIGNQLNDVSDFVKTLPPQAKVSIGWMVNGAAQLATPLTTDHQAALKGIHLPVGFSGADASPYFSLSSLAKSWPSNDRGARRVVVMITDGIDYYNPRYDPDDPYVQAAITDSVRSGLVVYTIYWQNRGRFDRTGYGTNAGQNLMAQLTQVTGGYSYWEGYGNPVALQPFFKDLDRRLQNQYEVAFTAPLKGKGTDVQSLHLKVNGVPAKVDAPQQVLVERSTSGM